MILAISIIAIVCSLVAITIVVFAPAIRLALEDVKERQRFDRELEHQEKLKLSDISEVKARKLAELEQKEELMIAERGPTHCVNCKYRQPVHSEEDDYWWCVATMPHDDSFRSNKKHSYSMWRVRRQYQDTWDNFRRL